MTSALIVLILAGDLIVGWLLERAVVRKAARDQSLARPVVIPFPGPDRRGQAQPWVD